MKPAKETQSAITQKNENENYFASYFGPRCSVIKNSWSLIAEINLEGRATFQKIEKSSQDDIVVTRVSKM